MKLQLQEHLSYLEPVTNQNENILGVMNCIESLALLGHVKAIWDCKRTGFILQLDGFSNLAWNCESLAAP